MIEIEQAPYKETKTFRGKIELDKVYTFEVEKTIEASGITYDCNTVKAEGEDDDESIDSKISCVIYETIEKHCNKHGI
jgi:hypothetical protein